MRTSDAKKSFFIAGNAAVTAVTRQGEREVKGEVEAKRRSEQGDSIFESQLKKLKEEPPESQHGPESQPTPFIYEPPVVHEETMSDTLPTPAIEIPTPLPDSLVAVPVMNMVPETVTTPWSTQPTPKVDATDWLFISDPTPMPPARDDEGVVPELTQPTPVPPAATKPQSQCQGDSFAATAIEADGELEENAKAFEERDQRADQTKTETRRIADALPDSVFPTVSLDVVTDLAGRTKPVPPVPVMPKISLKTETRKTPSGKKGADLNFAAMLLERARAASANRQDSSAEVKNAQGDFAPKSSNLSKLKVFVSAEENPESAHPPAQTAPEDVHPMARATI